MTSRHEAVRISDGEVVVRYGDLEICRLTSQAPLEGRGTGRLWLLDERFPLEAERMFCTAAVEAGWAEERIQLTCFLSRLYQLLSMPTYLLTPSAFSNGTGVSGKPPMLGELTKHVETPVQSLLHLWQQAPESAPEDVDHSGPFWAGEYVGLINDTDFWLAGGPGPGGDLDERDEELALQLMEMEDRTRREVFAQLTDDDTSADAEDPQIQHRAAVELRRKLVKSISEYRTGGYRKWNGLDETLPRLTWHGRDAFLMMYARGADGLDRRVLRDQLGWTDAERHAYRFMHTCFWNNGLLVPRVDDYFREFMFLDEQEEAPIIRLAVFNQMAAPPLGEGDMAETLWYLYLRTACLHVRHEQGRDRAPEKQDPSGAVDEEPVVGAKIRDDWFTEEHRQRRHDVVREIFDDVRNELSERDARIVRMVYLENVSQKDAAQRVGVHPSTVSRIISSFDEVLRERADGYE